MLINNSRPLPSTLKSKRVSRPATAHEAKNDADRLIKSLIDTTERLIDIAEREKEAIARDDVGTFVMLQDEKEKHSEKYMSQSKHFRARAKELKDHDPASIDKMGELQELLSQKMRSNSRKILQMQENATPKQNMPPPLAGSTLLSAQEIGQNSH